MKHTSYFVITPKSALAERLKVVEGLSDLSRALMWSGNEVLGGFLTRSDMEEIVKIFFLETLQGERGDHEKFTDLFSEFSSTVDYFDFRWTLTRVSLDMEVEIAMENAIILDRLRSLGLGSGNERINEYFSLIENQRSGGGSRVKS